MIESWLDLAVNILLLFLLFQVNLILLSVLSGNLNFSVTESGKKRDD